MKETKPFLPSGLGNIVKRIRTESETSSETLEKNTPPKLENQIGKPKEKEWRNVFANESPTRPEKMPTTISTNSEMVESVGMSLIDESANYMFELMKDSQNSVNDSCNCAKQIQSLLRLKLDAIRLAKELKK